VQDGELHVGQVAVSLDAPEPAAVAGLAGRIANDAKAVAPQSAFASHTMVVQAARAAGDGEVDDAVAPPERLLQQRHGLDRVDGAVELRQRYIDTGRFVDFNDVPILASPEHDLG